MANSDEDPNIRKLKTLIEALTHSGLNTLDEELFKQVKKLCKTSQDYVLQTYNFFLNQLKKNNSQIRFLAFQICKELFSRSVVFRDNVIKDLRLILKLSAEIDSAKRLPPPKTFAESLKALAITTLKKWVEEFGETLKELKVAYTYLEKCKEVNFETVQVRSSVEQLRENEQQRQLRAFADERIKKLMEEYESNQAEIQMTVTSLSNCVSLLLPTLEDFFIPESNSNENQQNNSANKVNDNESDEESDDEEAPTDDLRQFGISSSYNLCLELDPTQNPKIVKTEENSSVIENAKDCVKLINNKFLPMVKKWSKIYCKYSNGNTNEIKKIIDLKESLENILKKYNSLNIEGGVSLNDGQSSSDDDFEEVKKEGYEESVNLSEDESLEIFKIPEKPKKDTPVSVKETDINKPSTSGTRSSSSKHSDRKSRLLAVAPKLPFDIDLYHWEDEKLTAPTLVSSKIDVDKFWGSAESDDIHIIPNPEGVAALRTRMIEFTGKFEPVKWACRAPLPNGKLCPRMDRYKCPFHGKIVARDELGKCKNPEDEKTENLTSGESSKPDWQDPEFLKDLQAATGMNLTIPDKKNKRKKSEKMNLTHKKMRTSSAALRIVQSKNLPGLEDVVKKQNNAYTRLCKKIFNKASVRRVSAALDKIDKKKFSDKFGDQFNYS